jgi:hypothetical protein
MKKILSIALMGLMATSAVVSADVLAGWDFEEDLGVGREYAQVVPSIAINTNSILTGFTFDGNNGSSDLTWGNSTATPAPVNLLDNATKFRAGNGSLIQDLTILVKDGAEVTLSSLNFDYLIPFNSSPRDFTLSYLSGDLGTGGVNLHSFSDSAKVTTMTGVDVDLTASAMTDFILTGGQSATFRFDFTDSEGATGAAFVDNIGILGTVDVIPEPGTLGLVAFFGSTVLFIRRRMKR